MTQYKHILFTADLVKEDDEIVSDKAASLAKLMGAKLSVLHVVEHFYTYDLSIRVAEWEEEVSRVVVDQLEDIGKRLEIPKERQHISFGRTKNAILKIANEHDVDLIVVGRHSRHGLSLLLFGSTASEVIESTNCDILAINLSEEN